MTEKNVNWDVLKFSGAQKLIRRAGRLGAELGLSFFSDERGNFAVLTVEIPGKTIQKSFHEVYGESVVPFPICKAKEPVFANKYIQACQKLGLKLSEKTINTLKYVGFIEEGEDE